MATYTIQRGDSLSKIAAQLGIKGGWQELYQRNKSVIGADPGRIYAGTKLSYGDVSDGTKEAGTTQKTPSEDTGATIADAIADPTREAFIKKYGTIEDLRPDEMFAAFAEERVNPEMTRQAVEQMRGYDVDFAQAGGYLSSRMQANRQGMINALERARKEAANQYVGSQNKLFGEWYNQQMYNYGTSKAPSDFQLQKFGLEVPETLGGGTYDPSRTYEYAPAIDFTTMFDYGGYAKPARMYNLPTVTGGTSSAMAQPITPAQQYSLQSNHLSSRYNLMGN